MKNIAEMEAGLMKNYEMEAGLMKRILLSGSGIFYKIYNIYFAPNCPRRVSRRIVRAELSSAELSAPNCPRRIVLRRIVREPT